MSDRFILATFFIAALFFPTVFAQSRKPDLVILNANVRTLDTKLPRADAVAISGSLITAVGSNKEIRALVGDETKTIDAAGKLVLPGFNDSHVHFLAIGTSFFSLDLRRARSSGEIIDEIRYAARFLPKGQWIRGGYWNSENFESGAFPSKQLIDAASPDHPLFLYNKDPETAFANSVALKIAGFDRKDKKIENGSIERGADGEPTGFIRGAAVRYLRAFAPPLSAKQEAVALETATNYAASLGITSVQDVHSDDNIEILRALDRAGKLKTRVYECIALPKWKSLAMSGIEHASGDGMLRHGCLKHFSDGDFAALPDLLKMMIPADKANLQIMVHAIGGTANQVVLDAFEQIERANGKTDRRFRIEHAFRLRDQDIGRFSASNAIASMQPHLFSGREPYQRLIASGAKIAFGSDASITDFNPMFGISAAVNLASPEEKMSVEEAVFAYTAGSAFAEFQENVKGTISVGKLADFVILSDDIFRIKPEEIRTVKAVMTIVGGRVVFKAD